MECTYSESWPETVTAAQARHEIKRHGLAWAEFIEECGEKQTYRSADVLSWLGY